MGKKYFQVTTHAPTDCLPSCFLCPFQLPFFSYRDVAQAPNYFASTLLSIRLRQLPCIFLPTLYSLIILSWNILSYWVSPSSHTTFSDDVDRNAQAHWSCGVQPSVLYQLLHHFTSSLHVEALKLFDALEHWDPKACSLIIKAQALFSLFYRVFK